MSRFSHFVLIALCLGVAAYAAVAYGFFPLGVLQPPAMRATFEAYSLVMYAHIFGLVLAVAIGPFQFLSKWRARHVVLHRWLGRSYLGIGVLIGGSAGLFMGLHAYGGLYARVGFTTLALAWLYSGARAYFAIRARDIVLHQQWMLRNFSLTLAALTLRLYLPTALIVGADFDLAYPVIAWLCWIPNLIVAEIWINRKLCASALEATV